MLEYAPDGPIVLLSPHMDDAALSCWTLLARDDLDVVVVNVFAATPAAGIVGEWDRRLLATALSHRILARLRRLARLEPPAPRRDSAWLIRTRVAEDARALAELGRVVMSLELLDAQYRAHAACEARAPTPTEILGELVRDVPRASEVLVPAAVGPSAAETHIDHVLVRSVVGALGRFGGSVRLYADIPYAARLGWPDWVDQSGGSAVASAAWDRALRSLGIDGLVPQVRELSMEERRRKRDTLRRYRTQWKAMACGLEELRFEVFWRLPDG